MVWPSRMITLTFGKAFNIPLAKVSWQKPPTAKVASSQEADLWCFFGIFEKSPGFWMHFFFFCSKNEELQKEPTRISLQNTQDFKRMIKSPLPKGWPFWARKIITKCCNAAMLQNLDGTSISTKSWEHPMEYTKFLKSKNGEICPILAQLDCWKIWINKNSLPKCWKLVRHGVCLPQSYNNMPHHFAHKIMPFPWHLDWLKMTPPIDPTCLQPFNKVKLPSNLETLTFGEKFNQILELPPKLCLRFLMTNLTTTFGWRNPCFENAHDISRSSVLFNCLEI